MRRRGWRVWTAGSVLGLILVLPAGLRGEEASPSREQPAEPAADELPPVPQGIEVLARGPVHEAFATPATDPAPTKPVPKQPPEPLEELPPDEKPEGNVVWIGGYWAWDDERNDFLWVSGIWRTPPPGKRWVAGYWRPDGNGGWQWVPGFWAAEQQEGDSQEVTYLPQPPPTPDVAPPGQAPTPDSFYVPGHWVWNGTTYVWRAGYWARVQPGYVWVPAHYRWTPGGYVFIPGYWDLAVADRGVLYAPVIVDHAVVGATFVYTPTYVVRETVVIDSLFIRPCACHYYFGDYYGVVYRDLGFESCIVYSRRRYDPLIVYARYEHRHVPDWDRLQIDICLARHAGRAPCPPRTLTQQKVVVKNVTNVKVVNNVTNINQTVVNVPTTVNHVSAKEAEVLVPSKKLAAVKGVRTVPLDPASRSEAKQQAQTLQQVAAERQRAEVTTAGAPSQPRRAKLNVPKSQPVAARLPTAGTPPAKPAAKPEKSADPPAAAGRTVPPSAAPARAGKPEKPAPERAAKPSAPSTPTKPAVTSPSRPAPANTPLTSPPAAASSATPPPSPTTPSTPAARKPAKPSESRPAPAPLTSPPPASRAGSPTVPTAVKPAEARPSGPPSAAAPPRPMPPAAPRPLVSPSGSQPPGKRPSEKDRKEKSPDRN